MSATWRIFSFSAATPAVWESSGACMQLLQSKKPPCYCVLCHCSSLVIRWPVQVHSEVSPTHQFSKWGLMLVYTQPRECLLLSEVFSCLCVSHFRCQQHDKASERKCKKQQTVQTAQHLWHSGCRGWTTLSWLCAPLQKHIKRVSKPAQLCLYSALLLWKWNTGMCKCTHELRTTWVWVSAV